MDKKLLNGVAALVAVVFINVCATGYADDPEVYADKAISLGWVAGAVQGFVEFGSPPDDLSGEALVREATKDNPNLLEPLSGYYVIGRKVGNYSSVLMCDAEQTRAIAEDAGCTSAKLDAQLWGASPVAPCAFQLEITDVCAGR